jgi:hypothetical protein
MGHRVDQEIAQSQRDPDLETEAARQAHYIKWAKIFGILNPCGYYEGFIRIVVIYIKYVQCGLNYNNKQVLCSAIVQGYTMEVDNLFKLRSFSPPTDLSDQNNMTATSSTTCYGKRILQGNVLHLTTKILPSYLRQSASPSKCKDSVSDLLFDVVALSRYIGPCLSEYAHTTQDKVNHHTYPYGKMVIKTFIANDFILYDEKKCVVKDLNKDSLQRACFVKITWHIQKNHQNG